MAFQSVLVLPKISLVFTWSSQVCGCSRYHSDDVEYIHSKKTFFCYISNGQGEYSIMTVVLRLVFVHCGFKLETKVCDIFNVKVKKSPAC